MSDQARRHADTRIGPRRFGIGTAIGACLLAIAAHAHDGHVHGPGELLVLPVISIGCDQSATGGAGSNRPTRAFIERLEAVGYDRRTARDIAERVCNDPAAGGTLAGMRTILRQILTETLPH